MNEKEAKKEIQPFEKYKAFPFFALAGSPLKLFEAKGYLEAIKKTDVLVKVIKRRIESHDHDCSVHTLEKQAIAQWEKDK